MLIELKKFGDILTSREAGREALSAFLPTLNAIDENEKITIDFQDVAVLTPSWADEFIRPILEKHYGKVSFINDTNPSVKAAMRFADPKLNLNTITVFEDKIVFDEDTDDKIEHSDLTQLTLTFPYSDEDALLILRNHKIKTVYIEPVDKLSDSRLKAVIEKLRQAGITSIPNK